MNSGQAAVVQKTHFWRKTTFKSTVRGRMHVGLYWWLWRQSNCKDLDDAQRWQPPASRDRNENRPQEGEGGGTGPEAEEPRTARGHGGKAGEHTKRTHKHRQDRTEREAGRRQAKASEATKRGRTGEQTDRQTRRRRGETTASERTKAKAGTPEASSADSAQDHLGIA